MAQDPELLEILACPEDKGPLLYFEDENLLYNPRLQRKYRIDDDIPVMLVALLLFHIDQGFFMTAVVADAATGKARVVGVEYPLLVLSATLALVLLGGGALAMTDDDRW